jgi:hypothetical protein
MGFKGTKTRFSVAFLATSLAFLTLWPLPSSMASPNEASLSVDLVSARGRQETLLNVSAPGRYAVTAKSDQGTAVSIIDRMTGPGPSSGAPGEENGRVDLLLDEGEYKIVARSHEEGSGKAKLAVHTFTELNAPGFPLLIENKPVAEQLGDYQQRSFWIQVKSTSDIILEAAGRNLSDLRLWKDGSWLYDAMPSTELLDPLPGRPLRAYRMALKLQPGLYLLTTYGGPAEPWSEADDQHPLYLRYGIPRLPEAGRKRFEIGPLGIDRFLVPAQANFYRLELPESVKTSLEVGTFSASRPFDRRGRRVQINKESRLPVAEISTRSTSGYELVTVTGTAGQPYILQHFDARDSRQFRESGAFWLSTIHSGDPRDSVDATALLFELPPSRSPIFRAEDVIEIGPGAPWSGRFNLLEDGTAFLKILQAGTYTITAPGSDILVKVEPFMITRPRDYRTPDFSAPKAWNLDRGYHVLTARPLKKGIVTLSVTAANKSSNVLDQVIGWVKGDSPVEPSTAEAGTALQNPSAIFEKVNLKHNANYSLYINRQPGVRAGMVLRPLPMDLRDALPLSLLPGQTIQFSFKAANQGEGTIRALAEDGSPLELSLDGREWSDSLRAGNGGTLRVRNPMDNIAVASVWLEEDRDRPEAPLPPLPANALRTLPRFTTINDTAPQYFDLGSRSNRTFMIKVREPAFYNLESTGLLDTEGNLRAKIIISLGRDSGSGTGRNFFVGRYLREGDYQVTVATRGKSVGHLGLELSKSDLLEGGDLREGIPARVTLPEGQGVVYTLKIRERGTFRLTGYGLDRVLPFRLEDGEGWPLIAPNRPMDRTIELAAGSYRIVLLPEKVVSRRIVMVRRVPGKSEIEGHGPHPISLNTDCENVWMESGKGKKRPPDVWTFDLAASADIAVSMTGEMEGKLVRVSGNGGNTEPVTIPTTGWKGRLEEGRYRLEAVCSRINNRVPYQLSISTGTLIPGLSRDARAPVDIPISVGTGGLVEVSSFGKEDVRARLVNREGIPVARQDDRPDDWNFQINRRLDPGQYTLQVRPVGRENAHFKASMELFGESNGDRITVPSRVEIVPDDNVTLLPVKIKRPGVVSLSARSAENVGLALEQEVDGGRWETLWSGTGKDVTALVPFVDPGLDLRLRLWSLDRRNLPVDLFADLTEIAAVAEAEFRQGVNIMPSHAGEGMISAVTVSTARPGLFRVEGDGSVRGSSRPLEAFSKPSDGLLRAGPDGLWMAFFPDNIERSFLLFQKKDILDRASQGEIDRNSAEKMVESLDKEIARLGGDDGGTASPFTLSGQRFVLSGDDPVSLALAPGEGVTCDVEGGSGFVLVEAVSLGGQPGVRLSEDTGETDVVMAVAQRSAVAVLMRPDSPVATVFNAGDSNRKMDLKLVRRSYPSPQREDLPWGQGEGLLGEEGAKAVIYTLPSGSKRIRISSSGDVAVALLKNDRVSSVSWDGADALDELLVSEADQLVLMLTGNSPARYALQVLPHEDGEAFRPVEVSKPFEHRFIDSGTARIRVKGGEGVRLKVEGNVTEATLVTSQGRVLTGIDLPFNEDDGELIVRHDPGHVLAWIEDGDGNTGLWGGNEPSFRRSLSKPDVIPLSGGAAAIELNPQEPSVAHIRTDTPTVIRSMVTGAAARTGVHPDGGRLDLYLPEGQGEVWIRGLGGAALEGSVRVSFSPAIRIGEGLGPEILIPGGESRFFTFKVDRYGKVGIGVRGDSDVVRCQLQDPSGKVLGEGVVQMPTLDPGDYLIRLTVPPSVEPVRARPAVVGLTLPATGPPEEEIRKYLKMAGAEGGQ